MVQKMGRKKMAHPQIVSSREAAFLALLEAWRETSFLTDSLKKWQSSYHPSSPDFHLAQEIAYGTMQRTLTLDAIAKDLSTQNALKLKLKEKTLLRMALYQVYYMDRLPLYAITNETVALADRYCHYTFKNFLNALLRKTPSYTPHFNDWSVKYSFPPLFIEKLFAQVGKEKTEEILTLGNQPSLPMMRKRVPPFTVEPILDSSLIPILAQSPDLYIQNSTPVHLMKEMAAKLPSPPTRILDLCASPGGKILFAHDLFPKASLFVNDVSEAKIKRIEENLRKYSIQATSHIGLGENYSSSTSFDLVIVDVPCSNTGVLNKRPEARWRFNEETLKSLEEIQRKLLKKALELVSPHGAVWYMTCSILQEENEAIVAPYHPSFARTLYPDPQGGDGGFGAILFPKP